ncbi:MAG: hypothetical protein FJY36_04140 [Betaproteobacteria bacterium]|nr:hypothetical protein [Betaproteobacteria bacterium]
MRNAPLVLVPVGRFVWGVRIAASLALISLIALLAWLWQMQAAAGQLVGLLLAWLVLAGLSAWAVRQQAWPSGQLRWDGQSWWFQAEGAGSATPVRVRLVWDGGSAICLRLKACAPDARQQMGYACLCAQDLPGAWHGLRCAVYQGDTV